MLDRLAESFGASTRRSIREVGALGIFLWDILRALPSTLIRFHLVVEQMMIMGVYSIPVVMLTSAFIGAVSAWQAKYLFSDVIPPTYLGTAVGKAVFTELGPVLTALVITGRVGAKLAAELGTMRVTEQLDAMTTLSLDPYKYLLAPRLFAGAVMAPVTGTSLPTASRTWAMALRCCGRLPAFRGSIGWIVSIDATSEIAGLSR